MASKPSPPRPSPAGAGDFSGDLAERAVSAVAVEEAAVGCRGHLMRPALPFAQEPRTGFDGSRVSGPGNTSWVTPNGRWLAKSAGLLASLQYRTGSLLRGEKFPVRESREFARKYLNIPAGCGWFRAGEVELRDISLQFPCKQGSSGGDRFAWDCVHHHAVHVFRSMLCTLRE